MASPSLQLACLGRSIQAGAATATAAAARAVAQRLAGKHAAQAGQAAQPGAGMAPLASQRPGPWAKQAPQAPQSRASRGPHADDGARSPGPVALLPLPGGCAAQAQPAQAQPKSSRTTAQLWAL